MIGLLLLVLTALVVLGAAYMPGWLVVRILGGSSLLALALAPALGAAIAGIAALVAPLVGLEWSLLPWGTASGLAVAAALVLRRCGLRLPGTVLDGPLMPRGAVALAPLWVVLAGTAAVVPIAVQARAADAVLERWDTLYHLSALQRIRESGTASSLDLGSVSNSAAEPTAYPAGFHALASLVPGVPVPVALNGAVLALAVVPWALGIALLARTLFPKVTWAPVAAALAALLIPASPLNLWIHLSPIPNLTGFAMLPGALASVVALWMASLNGPRLATVVDSSPPNAPAAPPVREMLCAALLVGAAGLGLGLMHPNVAVTALLLAAVLTGVTALPHLRRTPALAAVPLLALVPVAALAYTPLGTTVTGFNGGLQLPWWVALRELLLGLLTVWPMALGAVLALMWWPGLVRVWCTEHRWLVLAWGVVAVMYVDAVLDSPLNLSILYYRGQDRLSMPLAMLSAVLVVPGLQAWSGLQRRINRGAVDQPLPHAAVALLVCAALVATGTSIPTRLGHAAKNLAMEYPGRGRFLQADELEAWEQAAPQMNKDLKVLASPFSGASHMYALHGQQVYFPVAGMTTSTVDRSLIQSVRLAADSPEHCQNFTDYGIGYIYQERRPYQFARAFEPINAPSALPGRVLFETEHSRLIEIDCQGTSDPGR